MNILSLFRDIFLEESNPEWLLYNPRDLTLHYKEELPPLYLDSVFVAASYASLEEKIIQYKYHSERHYGDLFVDLLSKVVDQYVDKSEQSIMIVAVPMHWSRYIYRGFDHTLFLAITLSKNAGIPHEKLLSTQWTRHQSKLGRKKRLENKKNTFRITCHHPLPENVILIDDVISTGSTANECAKVLKEHGVKKVIGIFLASNFV